MGPCGVCYMQHQLEKAPPAFIDETYHLPVKRHHPQTVCTSRMKKLLRNSSILDLKIVAACQEKSRLIHL